MVIQDALDHIDTFRYQMLSRMKMDCNYYLGYGDHHSKYLWALNERDHIDTMKALYNSLPEKPEWLTMAEIEEYEAKMCH